MDLKFDLSELKTPSDYRAEGRTHVFPSAGSLDWFIRNNKEFLTTTKALVAPTGRRLINAKLFDIAVYEIGSHKFEEQANV